jgi:hypothetical protein
MLSLTLFSSCQTQNDQLECFNKSLQDAELKPFYNQLRQRLKDTLNDWTYVKGYERVKILKSVIWKIDEAVFISPKKDRAILLLLQQDTIKYTSEPSKEIRGQEKQVPTFLDYVQLIYANKENGDWHFYYQSMAVLVVQRNEDDTKNFRPTSFEKLSLVGQRALLSSYYKFGTCKYNPAFFDTWDIKNLKKKHEKINGYY